MAKAETWGGIGSAAVEKKTGRGWKQWFAVLDAAGAKELPHKEIARYLHAEHGVDGWWAQMVTVGYEQARGLRAKHETSSGFQVSGSKTVAVPLDRLYAAFADARQRKRWLGDARIEVRKATPSKSMRITWLEDDTSVEANFYAKGAGKSQVALQHRKLPTARAAAQRKAYWKERLEELAALLA
jgi:uncharacterized protein YndB with AHSA1/START domain